jgi:hypothetical protein
MLLLHYLRKRHPTASVTDWVSARPGRGVLQKMKFSWPWREPNHDPSAGCPFRSLGTVLTTVCNVCWPRHEEKKLKRRDGNEFKVIIQCPNQADRRVTVRGGGSAFPQGEWYSGWNVKLTITSIYAELRMSAGMPTLPSYAFMVCSSRFSSQGEDGKNRISSPHLYTQLGTAYPGSDRPLFALATRQLDPSAKKLRSSSCK